MRWMPNYSKTERRILAASVIGVLITLLLFFDDRLLRLEDRVQAGPAIGRLGSAGRGARHRSARDLDWSTASANDAIRVGDSVFTGEGSRSRVDLEKGGSIELGENSLITFTDPGSGDFAKLLKGTFVLSVDAPVNIEVGGRRMRLDGQKAKIDISLDGNKQPQFRLLEGKAKFAPANPSAEVRSATALTVGKKVELPSEPPVPRAVPALTGAHWRFEDFYQKRELTLERVATPASKRAVSIDLSWDGGVDGETVRAQISPNGDFAKDLISGEMAGTRWHLTEAFTGDNLWRLSRDGVVWSKPAKFRVDPSFLKDAPHVVSSNEMVPLVGDHGTSTVRLESPIEVAGYVVEASTAPSFAESETRLFFTDQTEMNLSFYRVGSYYYRFRGVSTKSELTEWSDVRRFVVVEPPPLGRPLLAHEDLAVPIQTPVAMDWSGPQGAQSYEVEIFNGEGQLIDVKSVGTASLQWTPTKTGRYTAKVYAVDEWKRRGLASRPQNVVVVPPVVITQPPPKAPETQVADARAPAADAQSSMTAKLPGLSHLNDSFRDSKFEIEGSAWAMQSKEQIYQSAGMPLSTGLGLRLHQWWGPNGIEGSFKTKVIGNVAADDVKPTQLELRYHRRWETGFPFGLARALQTSLFAGYESYRNPGSTNFAAKYDLVKFGTSLEFPLWARMDAGGEIVGGLGFDQSRKYEISGRMHYYWKKNISFGVGYRIHLFEAGSLATTPSLLPYREGYGEGYSVLRYHY